MSAKEINHSERAHALLSASGASRWMNCTASARMEEHFPEQRSSVFAEEGTLAHELAELKLRFATVEVLERNLNAFNESFDKIKAHELYSPEMEEHTDSYVSFVLEQFNDAKARNPDALLLIEERVSLEDYIEDSFGTCDTIIIANGIIDITDLKYGKGLRVSSQDNGQLKLYALGALAKYGILFDIHTVRLNIVQPRLDAVSSWELSITELETWAEEFVKPKAAEAFAGGSDPVPGDHCRFCRAKVHCKALNEEASKAAKQDFPDYRILTDEEVLEAYKISDRVTDYFNAVAEYVATRAKQGKKWTGFKLVEGRSVRQWSNVEAVEAKLKEEGYTEADFMTMKLQGLGALEKLLGKKPFEEKLGSLIFKPPGKPTLVPESDKRSELSSASDFDEIL